MDEEHAPLVWVLGAGAAVVAVLAIWRSAKRPMPGVSRGKAVGGPEARVGPDGYVPGTPQALAAQARVPVDVYALARTIASEVGGLPEVARIAVAWAVRTEAARRKITVAQLVTTPNGRFGRQNLGGRYCATAATPHEGDLETARRVLGGQVPDPTKGATLWDSPRAQDALLAKGTPGYKKSAAQVADARRAAGYELVALLGVPANTIRFWRKSKGALVS